MRAAQILSLLLLLPACQDEECESTSDSCSQSCEEGLSPVCVARGICQCVLESNSDAGEAGLSEVGLNEAGLPIPPPDCPSPQAGDLVINEILIDGAAEGELDEFVEIVNQSDHEVSLLDLIFYWKSDEKIRFTGGCLPALGAVAIFTGEGEIIWNPSISVPRPEVQSFRFSNSSDALEMRLESAGILIHSVEQPAQTPEGASLIREGVSATRFPDLEGPFQRHDDLSDAKSSPGHCVGGQSFQEGCSSASPPDGGVVEDAGDAGDLGPPPECPDPRAEELVINEILIDGEAEGESDEFVEIVNRSDHAISLQDLVFYWKEDQKIHFTGGCLPAQGAVAVFTGAEGEIIWNPNISLPAPEVQSFRFSNSSDSLQMRLESAGALIHAVDQSARTPEDTPLIREGVSATRFPDLEGPFQRHDDISEAKRSPGSCVGGQSFQEGCTAVTPLDGGEPEDAGDAGLLDQGPRLDEGNEVDEGPDTPALPACGRPPQLGELIINELIIDAEGDENLNEFVEIFNNSGEELNLSGLKVQGNKSDGSFSDRAEIFSGCIPDDGVMVIYPSDREWLWIPEAEGIEHSETSLRLTNSRALELRLILDELVLEQVSVPLELIEEGTSVTRFPDLSGEMVLHNSVSGQLLSPGTCADGSPLADGCR